MSRSYRIKVSESLSRVIKAHDKVSTQLEILEILPCEETEEIIKEELQKQGYEERDGKMVKEQDGVVITIDPKDGTVEVTSESSSQVDLEQTKEESVYEDSKEARAQLKKKAQSELEKQAEKKASDLQDKVTDRLEKQLGNLKEELDQTVNRVTTEALKRKAGRLGNIKEMTNDEKGNMTIVVEV